MFLYGSDNNGENESVMLQLEETNNGQWNHIKATGLSSSLSMASSSFDKLSSGPYANFNMNFVALNHQLTAAKKKNKQLEKEGFRRVASTLLLKDSGVPRTFAEVLDEEVQRIVLFYLDIQGDIAKEVWHLLEDQANEFKNEDHVSLDQIENYRGKYRNVSSKVISLLDFLRANVEGLRKLIKRHDLLFDRKMGSMYFNHRIGSKGSNSSPLLQLYHQEGVRAIIGSLQKAFEDLLNLKYKILGLATPFSESSNNFCQRSKKMQSFSDLQALTSPKSKIPSKKSWHNFSRSGMDEDKRLPSAASGKISGTGFFNQAKTILDAEPILEEINEAAKRVIATQEMTLSDFVATHSTMALELAITDIRREDEREEALDEETLVSKFLLKTSSIGLILNLFTTFLYMANQYILAPTSGSYSNALGMSEYLNGLILGLAPAAALISSLLYSSWSNYSFKSPLLCGVFFGFLGNLLYAVALQFNSPQLLFAGRLISGFGGTRVISRRYIADHVSLSDRTNASSSFITVAF